MSVTRFRVGNELSGEKFAEKIEIRLLIKTSGKRQVQLGKTGWRDVSVRKLFGKKAQHAPTPTEGAP